MNLSTVLFYFIVVYTFPSESSYWNGHTCARIPSWLKSVMTHRTKRSPIVEAITRNRIVGGDEALSPIPWQVHIHISTGFTCGGTILDEETVLSAAHCFHPLGSINNNDYIEAGIRLERSSSGQRVLVQEIINHPNYNSRTQDNDIAILKLKTHLTFNENVTAACLPKPSFAPEETGELSVLSGWGRTIERGPSSRVLQAVSVPLMTNEICAKTEYGSGIITSNMVCAGYPSGGSDTCQGDSGGPLVVQKSSTDDSAIVYGVVSWGYGCARPDTPGVYARVTKYVDWILNHMKVLCPSSIETSCPQSEMVAINVAGKGQMNCLFQCPAVTGATPSTSPVDTFGTGYKCVDTNHNSTQFSWCCKTKTTSDGIPQCPQEEGVSCPEFGCPIESVRSYFATDAPLSDIDCRPYSECSMINDPSDTDGLSGFKCFPDQHYRQVPSFCCTDHGAMTSLPMCT